LILTLFNFLIGKFFYNIGGRDEGEYRDDKLNGQGNKNKLLNDLLILTLFNILIGKSFFINGDRYEGEFKDGKKQG